MRKCDFNTGDVYASISNTRCVNTQANQRPNIRELLALNMKYLRAKRGLSQDQLALVAGLDRTFVAHVERLKRNISLDNLEKLAGALGVSVASLLSEGLKDNES